MTIDQRQDRPAPTKGPMRSPATMPWRRVLGLMAAVLAVWLFLDANTLQHNAQVSPVGVRRTVALALLGPIAVISRVSQVSRIEEAANAALGRSSNGAGGHTFVVIGPTGPPPTVPVTSATHHPPIHPDITTLPPNPLQNPTAADPLRVLLVGDSLGLDLGGSLQNRLASTGVVAATLDGKESTGLTRPDYFNWPAELSSDLPRVNPQVVVVMMGANDPQNFLGPPGIAFGTDAWNKEYRHRAAQFMREATSQGAQLIWVGLPPMQDQALNAKIQVINQLQQEAAAKVPGVLYLPSTSIIGGPGGTFAPYVVKGGQNINVRTPDGIHITPQGGAVLSNAVVQLMRQKLGIQLS